MEIKEMDQRLLQIHRNLGRVEISDGEYKWCCYCKEQFDTRDELINHVDEMLTLREQNGLDVMGANRFLASCCK